MQANKRHLPAYGSVDTEFDNYLKEVEQTIKKGDTLDLIHRLSKRIERKETRRAAIFLFRRHILKLIELVNEHHLKGYYISRATAIIKHASICAAVINTARIKDIKLSICVSAVYPLTQTVTDIALFISQIVHCDEETKDKLRKNMETIVSVLT